MPYESPDPAAVAAVLHARTTGEADEVGDFTADTRPTADAVGSLIATAEGLLLPGLGDLSDGALACPDAARVTDGARALVTLGAAMLVEASYYPEQAGQDLTVAGVLRELVSGDGYDRVADAAARCRGEATSTPGGEATSPDAAWAFPQDEGGMVGWQSRWRTAPRREPHVARRRRGAAPEAP